MRFETESSTSPFKSDYRLDCVDVDAAHVRLVSLEANIGPLCSPAPLL